MTKWKDCVKEPSEIGKKVLCMHRGDFYVATRIEELYIPLPFADHYFCNHLCKPEKWSEIDFPDPYTGFIRIMPGVESGVIMKLSEAREKYPEAYYRFVKPLIDSIAQIPRPKIIHKLNYQT